MMRRCAKGALSIFSILLVSAAVTSCGEFENENEAGEHGGGGSSPASNAPVSAVTCASNCSALGACAEHGGVACSQGPDSDGSVICADGYRGSSITYRCP